MRIADKELARRAIIIMLRTRCVVLKKVDLVHLRVIDYIRKGRVGTLIIRLLPLRLRIRIRKGLFVRSTTTKMSRRRKPSKNYSKIKIIGNVPNVIILTFRNELVVTVVTVRSHLLSRIVTVVVLSRIWEVLLVFSGREIGLVKPVTI